MHLVVQSFEKKNSKKTPDLKIWKINLKIWDSKKIKIFDFCQKVGDEGK